MSTSELLAPWNPYQNRHVCTACGYMFLHDVPQSHYESVHHKAYVVINRRTAEGWAPLHATVEKFLRDFRAHVWGQCEFEGKSFKQNYDTDSYSKLGWCRVDVLEDVYAERFDLIRHNDEWRFFHSRANSSDTQWALAAVDTTRFVMHSLMPWWKAFGLIRTNHKKAPGYLRFSAIRGNPWHFKGMHWSSHHESE